MSILRYHLFLTLKGTLADMRMSKSALYATCILWVFPVKAFAEHPLTKAPFTYRLDYAYRQPMDPDYQKNFL